MKNILQGATIFGFITILIGAALADSNNQVVPVSVISIGLVITAISLIITKRYKK